MSFVKIGAVTAILYLRVQMKFSLYFLQFSFDLDKTDIEDAPKNLLNGCKYLENRHIENHTFLRGCKLISVHSFHIYCVIWMKFGITRSACNAVQRL